MCIRDSRAANGLGRVVKLRAVDPDLHVGLGDGHLFDGNAVVAQQGGGLILQLLQAALVGDPFRPPARRRWTVPHHHCLLYTSRCV